MDNIHGNKVVATSCNYKYIFSSKHASVVSRVQGGVKKSWLISCQRKGQYPYREVKERRKTFSLLHHNVRMGSIL